jgi:hypothetical protein
MNNNNRLCEFVHVVNKANHCGRYIEFENHFIINHSYLVLMEYTKSMQIKIGMILMYVERIVDFPMLSLYPIK